MRTTRWLFAVGLGLALPLVACEPAGEEAPGADEPMMEQPAEGAAATESVEVTNAMPHPMVVYQTQDGQRSELGTVEANATQTFSVDGQEGATIDLVAEDTAQTHAVEESVTIGGPASTWQLGG